MNPKQARQGSSKPATRRRLSSQERRESILKVARHAFAARGYDGVKTQELATVAEISEALLYQHFSSKADLYCEVVRRSAEEMRNHISAAATSSPQSDRLERTLDAFVAFAADGASGWSLLSSKVSDPEIAAYQREVRGEAVGALADLLESELEGRSTPTRRRRVEGLSEVLAGGAEAAVNWCRQHPDTSRGEPVSLLTDFAREGLRSLAPGSARKGEGRRKRA